MPNKTSITLVTLTLGLASVSGALAQAANGPPASLATKPSPPEAAQKRPTDVKTTDAPDKGMPERSAQARDTDRPAIGPSTTQGLAQDSIARSSRR